MTIPYMALVQESHFQIPNSINAQTPYIKLSNGRVLIKLIFFMYFKLYTDYF